MLNNKLFLLIKTFDSSTEYASFSKFLRSPYFNKKEELILLFDIITKATKKKVVSLKNEDIYNSIFPKKTFDKRKWERLKNQLVNLILDFWQIEEFKNSERLQSLAAVNAFKKRHLDKINHDFIANRINKTLEKSFLTTNDNFDLFLFYQDYHIYPKNTRFNQELDNIELADQHLNSFFILSKLHLACELTNHQVALEYEIHIPLLEEIEKYINPQLLEKHPIIKVYQKILDLNQNEFELIKYYELETLFLKYKESIIPKKQHEILLLLINLHIRHFNKGNSEIKQSLFELYKKGIESKILFYNNTISKETFTNIITLAAHLGEFDWTKKIIKIYSPYLPELIRKNAISFALGNIAFCKKEFHSCIQILSQYKYDKSIYDTLSRFFIIKSLFELMDTDDTTYERLLQTTDAFIRYIDHRPFGDKRIQGYKNFARLVRRIARMKKENNTLEEIREKFEEEIKGDSLIKGKIWLLEKIRVKKKNVAT